MLSTRSAALSRIVSTSCFTPIASVLTFVLRSRSSATSPPNSSIEETCKEFTGTEVHKLLHFLIFSAAISKCFLTSSRTRCSSTASRRERSSSSFACPMAPRVGSGALFSSSTDHALFSSSTDHAMTGALSPAALDRLVFRLEGPFAYTRRNRAKRGADVDESVCVQRESCGLLHATHGQQTRTHSTPNQQYLLYGAYVLVHPRVQSRF